MTMRKILFALTMVSTLLLSACSGNNNEKKISFAYANWAEGIAVTHLTKAIFEEQGYQVELLNADIAPIFASLSRKKADVFMDAWMPVTHKDYMAQYGDRLETIGNMYENAKLGLVVPEYVDINSIEELKQNADKFNNEIVGIDAGAGIMKVTETAIKDYDLGMKLMTGSGPAMTATLQKAIDKQEWVVVTGWTPHWMFGRYRLKFLEDPKGVYGAAETIHTIAWKGFSKKDPFAAALLKNIRLSDEAISSLMTAVEGTKTNEMDAVKEWMKTHRELIDSWIPQAK